MNKNIITCLCILFIVFFFTPFCPAAERETVSGQIITGFRILPVPPEANTIDYTVYRGDYIKFSFPVTLGTLPFSIPAMKYKGSVLPNPDKSPYFKMKTTGTYAYSLGTITGKITVIDLVRTSYTEVTAKEGAEILENLKPFILDVRTIRENSNISIPGSQLIPIHQLQARINELDPYKDSTIFVYCATGNRSTVAARILADSGFKRIYNLRYGIYDWASNGLPTKRK